MYYSDQKIFPDFHQSSNDIDSLNDPKFFMTFYLLQFLQFFFPNNNNTEIPSFFVAANQRHGLKKKKKRGRRRRCDLVKETGGGIRDERRVWRGSWNR